MSNLDSSLLTIMALVQLKFEAKSQQIGLRQMYAYRCVQCEYSMRFSEKFLQDAALNAKLCGDREWCNYFEKHLEEEKGHHAWALHDLEGIKANGILLPDVSPCVVDIIDYQKEMLSAGSYLHQFGYCLAVESFQGGKNYWLDYQRRSGVPSEFFLNVLNHAVIDVGHAAEIEEKYLEMDISQRKLVNESAMKVATGQLAAVSSM